MKRKLLLLFGCLAAVVLAGYVTLRLTEPNHRITRENFNAIQDGMTEEEVVAILGPPSKGEGNLRIGWALQERPWTYKLSEGVR